MLKELFASVGIFLASIFGGDPVAAVPPSLNQPASAIVALNDRPDLTVPAASSATTTITNQYITQPVIEREVLAQNAITREELDASLAALRTDLLSVISSSLPKAYTFAYPAVAAPVSTQTFALSQKIDQLANVTISNATVSGVTGLTNADIPDDITASNYLPLSGGSLTFASSTRFSVFDKAYFGGSATSTFDTLGSLALAGSLSISTTTATSTISTGGFAVGSSQFVVQQSSGNVGIGSASPAAKLYIQQTSSALTGGVYGLSLSQTVIPTASASANYYGAYIQSIYNSAYWNSATVDGVTGKAYVSGAGKTNQATGLRGVAEYGGSSPDDGTMSLYGGRFQSKVSGTGHAEHVIGIKLDTPEVAGAAGETFGLYIDDQTPSGGGTLQNDRSAIHIEGLDPISWSAGNGATHNIELTPTDSDKLVLTGANFGIGTTSPTALLGLQGSIGVSATHLYLAANGRIGIGTASPSAALHINAGAAESLRAQGTGNYFSFYDTTGATRYAYIQANAQNLVLAADGAASYLTLRTNSAERARIDQNGYLGLATTSPWRTLSVTGTVGFDGLTGSTGAGSLCLSASKEVVYNSGSDACLPSLRDTKHDISSLSFDALQMVNALDPVSFVYNDGDGRVRYGFIAEDTAVVDSHLVTYSASGTLSGIDDRSIISVVVKAIQELSDKIASLALSFTTAELHYTRAIGDEMTVKKLCIGSTCVDEAQLQALLANASSAGGASGSPSPSEEEGAAPDTEAPIITVSGNNPALVSVGDTYNDLGATVADNVDVNLGIRVFVGSTPMDQAVIDTSEPNEWHIHYVATDNAGNTATSTRTVIVEGPSIVPSGSEEPSDEEDAIPSTTDLEPAPL